MTIRNLLLATLSVTSLLQTSLAHAQDSAGLEAFRLNLYEPILQKQCMQCHGNNGIGPSHSSEDIRTSYKNVQRYVNFMDISNSKFVIKGSNGHGNVDLSGMSDSSQTKVTVTQAELAQALQRWWNQGERAASLQSKILLPAQGISDLPDKVEFKTLSWDLDLVNPLLLGAKFEIDIKRFSDANSKSGGAFKLSQPRISTNDSRIEIKNISVMVNGILDSSANNYADVDAKITTRAGEFTTLSPHQQIVLVPSKDSETKIGFAFEVLGLAAKNNGIKIDSQMQKKQTTKPATPNQEKNETKDLPIFDESIVGRAGHFVSLKASKQNPIEFEMGSPENQIGRYYNEPLHRVRLTTSFEMQSTTVTQLQWYMVMNENPSRFRAETICGAKSYLKVVFPDRYIELCKNHPVEKVSWDDAHEFIKKINQMQNEYTYRLPTEAEWEYMAKAGLPADYAYGWGNEFDGNYAWYAGNSGGLTHEVATKLGIPSPQDPNDLMFDIVGNVLQWVEDGYEQNYGLTSKQLQAITEDPHGLSLAGSRSVIRGGNWFNSARNLRSGGYRYGSVPSIRDNYFGFRLVRTKR